MKWPVMKAAAWACLVGIVSGSPTINFPINAQVPPVARLSQTFSFVFAENTFISTASEAAVNYTLDSAPSWLSLESSERWLHGTPEDSDITSSGNVVGVPFVLIATDSTGSTSLNVTLVVSRESAPTVDIPVATQLADSGLVYSEPSSILAYPDSYFNFTFSQSTFSSPDLNYYAISSDNSPLPSWVTFDVDTLMFSGTTPSADSLVEPPQTFNLQLVASDVTGFAAAFVSLSIVVGSHEVTADDPSVVLNATAGTELVYNGLQNGIKVDGQVVGPSNITAKILSSPPSWLTFDTATWALRGTPPSTATAHNAAFAISFYDALLDSVNVTFQVDVDENGTVFGSTLPSMQAQRGSVFALNLSSYLVATDGVKATVETDPKQDWLEFNDTSLLLSGDVPASQGDSPVSVSVRATLHNATKSETFLLEITGSSATNSSSASASSSTAAGPFSSGLTASASKSSRSSLSKKEILMAVLIPTMLLASVVLVVACCMCCRRRLKVKRNTQNMDIPHPVPFSFVYRGEDDTAASMRTLNQVHNVSNADSANAEKQGAMLDQANIGMAVTHVPIGTAITISSSDADSFAKVTKEATKPQDSSQPAMSVFATYEDGQSETLYFPAPPAVLDRLDQSTSSASSGTGADHSERDLAAAAVAGQWPFEESTLRSESVSIGDGVGSLGSREDEPRRLDPLGIYSSAVPSHSQNSEPVLPRRQTVRYSTPMATPAEIDGRVSASLRAEYLVSSQEAIVLDGPSVADPVPSRDGAGDLEAGVKEAGVNIDDGATDAKPGFLFEFAARIANRFKGNPPTEDAPEIPSVPTESSLTQGWPVIRRFSSSGHPSPDAPSFDTDVGSVTIGSITTAQPYKPRPVFIGNVSRITEESPQPKSPMWSQTGRAVSSGSGATGSKLTQQERVCRTRSNGGDNFEDVTVDDDETGRIGRLRPAFLRQSHLERDATTDLSKDIASSLRSRRPTSSGSGLSGISAAMEEVLSMLLFPDGSEVGATPDGSRSPGRAQDDGASDVDGYARSSNSWETLPSSERNWTSHYGTRAASAASSSPVSPGIGASSSSMVLPQANVHNTRMWAQQGANFQIRTVTASSGATMISTNAETQSRHTSSFYPDENQLHPSLFAGMPAEEEETPQSTNNELEYPTPFVSSSSGAAVASHPRRPSPVRQDSSSSRPDAKSLQSSQLASLSPQPLPELSTSTAGSGIRAFI